MLVRYSILILSLLATLPAGPAIAQSFSLNTVTAMPQALIETSGLIRGHTPGQWWSHNDSGGDPALTCFDESGTVIRSVALRGVINTDWEEVTADDSGYVYVGDFGNNGNDRQDLMIYRIPHPDLVAGDSVTPESIRFFYPEQTSFPPASTDLHYDMEAMVAYGDTLFLFTKNRTSPFDGYTRRYWLPTTPGSHAAILIDSFYTNSGPQTNAWIGGAGLSPDREHLFLVSYPRAWLFSCYEGSDFFGGAVKEFTFSLTQKEGVAWLGNDSLYVTDELYGGVLGGNLYLADMTLYTYTPVTQLGADTTLVAGSLSIAPDTMPGASYVWSTGEQTQSITVTQSGLYIVTVVAPNGCTDSDTISVDITAGLTPKQPVGLHVYAETDTEMIVARYTLPTASTVRFSVVDVRGRTLRRRSSAGEGLRPAGEHVEHIAVNLATGYYWLRLEWEGGTEMSGFRIYRTP